MPTEVTNIIPKTGQPKTYKSFTRREIRQSWEEDAIYTLESLQKEDRFVIFFTNEVVEAIVVAALFIRELTAFPECTYYDFKTGALMLFYGGAGPINGDDEMAKALTRDMLERIIQAGNIDSIEIDPWGDSLFWKG